MEVHTDQIATIQTCTYHIKLKNIHKYKYQDMNLGILYYGRCYVRTAENKVLWFVREVWGVILWWTELIHILEPGSYFYLYHHMSFLCLLYFAICPTFVIALYPLITVVISLIIYWWLPCNWPLVIIGN